MKKITKKVIALLLVIVSLATVLIGCGQAPANSSNDAKDTSTNEEIKIAYFAPHQNNEYQISLREAAEAAAKKAGVACTVYVADNDAATQVSQIEQAISAGIKGILIDPVSNEGIAAGVSAAKKAGVPFVTVHESVAQQDDCTAFVGSDLRTGGKLKMEQVMKDFPDGANLAVLYGPLGQTAQLQITDGYKDALEAANKVDDYKYVCEDAANWNAEDALEKVSNWLSAGKKFDAIVCNNDGMAIGALRAVEAAKITDIKIYGLDAQQDVLAEIKKDKIRATIYNDFNGEATEGLNALLKAIKGEKVEANVSISPLVITKDNVDEYIK